MLIQKVKIILSNKGIDFRIIIDNKAKSNLFLSLLICLDCYHSLEYLFFFHPLSRSSLFQGVIQVSAFSIQTETLKRTNTSILYKLINNRLAVSLWRYHLVCLVTSMIFQPVTVLPLCSPRDIWHCIVAFLIDRTGIGCAEWVEARVSTKHSIVHKTVLTLPI